MLLKKKRFWGIVVAILLLAYCAKDIRTNDLVELSSRVNYWHLLLSIAFSFVFVISRAIRWRSMVHRYAPIPVLKAASLFCAGQMLNMTLPALTGQVGRVILFSKQAGLRKSHIVSTVVLEVVFDALSLVFFLLLTSLVFVFPDEYRLISILVFGGTLLILAILYTVIFSKRQVEAFLRKSIRPRWPRVYVSLTRFFRSFSKGLNLLKSSQHVAFSLGISLFAWAAHAASIYFLFKAFAFDLPFAAAAAVMIISTIALMIPITPGNAGTFEVAVSKTLIVLAVPKAMAVLFALTLHIVDIIPVFVLGIPFFGAKREAQEKAIQATPSTEEKIVPRPKAVGSRGKE